MNQHCIKHLITHFYKLTKCRCMLGIANIHYPYWKKVGKDWCVFAFLSMSCYGYYINNDMYFFICIILTYLCIYIVFILFLVSYFNYFFISYLYHIIVSYLILTNLTKTFHNQLIKFAPWAISRPSDNILAILLVPLFLLFEPF